MVPENLTHIFQMRAQNVIFCRLMKSNSWTLSQHNMPTNKTKNASSYLSETKTAEEKIVHFLFFLLIRSLWQDFKEP